MLETAKMEGSLTRPRKEARFFSMSSSNQTPACDRETSRASALQYVTTCQQRREREKKKTVWNRKLKKRDREKNGRKRSTFIYRQFHIWVVYNCSSLQEGVPSDGTLPFSPRISNARLDSIYLFSTYILFALSFDGPATTKGKSRKSSSVSVQPFQ